MISDAGLRRVVAAAHEAASDPGRFDDMLVLLSDVCGAHGSVLFTPMLDPEGKNLAASCGCCREAMVEYAHGWAAHDIWVREIRAKHRHTVPGDVLVGQEILGPSHLHRSPFHADFLRRYDIESVVSMLIHDGSGRLMPDTRVSLYRPPGAAPFGDAEKAAMRSLWPHLRSSVETYWLLRKAREFDRVVESALDEVPHPLWILREDAAFDYANTTARALMASDDHWIRCVGQRIVRLGDSHESELQTLVRNASRGVASTLVTTRSSGDVLERAVVHVIPVTASSPFARCWPRGRALLSLTLPSDADTEAAWLDRVAKHYGLTPAEARVLGRLVEGRSPKEIADEFTLALSTVRTHLRSLLSKTECRRQMDLLRIAMRH